MGNSKRRIAEIAACTALIMTCFLASCSRGEKLPNWMLGTWKVDFTDYSVEESWQEKDGKFQGQALWSGKLKSWKENLLLYVNADDDLVYRVTMDGSTKEFVCKDPGSDTLVFVNHANSFPKRLHYFSPDDTKLEVWIDNVDKDPNRIDFHFQKIK